MPSSDAFLIKIKDFNQEIVSLFRQKLSRLPLAADKIGNIDQCRQGAGKCPLSLSGIPFPAIHTELQLKSLEKILIARRARSSYETCFVISFLINHKTGSAVKRCLPD